MANAQERSNRKSGGQNQAVDKTWLDDFDSPIEQAKMHPKLHASLKALTGLDIFLKILLLCYANSWIDRDGGMFDALVFSGSFLLDVVLIIALMTVRVAKEGLR